MDTDKPNILIIDDKEANVDSLKMILDDLEYPILTALSAEEGWKILKENDIACLLLDVNMPNVSGFDLAKKIQNSQGLSQVPIIVFVTAIELGIENAKKGYDLGAVDYLIKPLNPTMVRTKVNLYCQLYLKQKRIEQLEAQNK
jgi:response regulator RpfG family c-di-GMP phosphodiesterase